MKIDADEGTYFTDVQTASVKRHLAKDANDNKLHNSASMEMIGHLSNEKQETTREFSTFPCGFVLFINHYSKFRLNYTLYIFL